MDDVRDAFAALFSRICGICYDDLSDEERKPFRVYGDEALRVVRDNREILFYAFGLPADSSTTDVAQLLRRHHIAISKALEGEKNSTYTTTFPCPYCGTTLVVTRKTTGRDTPITTTCQCGRRVHFA